MPNITQLPVPKSKVQSVCMCSGVEVCSDYLIAAVVVALVSCALNTVRVPVIDVRNRGAHKLIIVISGGAYVIWPHGCVICVV